jgi:hypothetical protein
MRSLGGEELSDGVPKDQISALAHCYIPTKVRKQEHSVAETLDLL